MTDETHDYRVPCETRGGVKGWAVRFDGTNVDAVAEFTAGFVDSVGQPVVFEHRPDTNVIVLSWDGGDGRSVVTEGDRVVRAASSTPASFMLVLSAAEYLALFDASTPTPEVS